MDITKWLRWFTVTSIGEGGTPEEGLAVLIGNSEEKGFSSSSFLIMEQHLVLCTPKLNGQDQLKPPHRKPIVPVHFVSYLKTQNDAGSSPPPQRPSASKQHTVVVPLHRNMYIGSGLVGSGFISGVGSMGQGIVVKMKPPKRIKKTPILFFGKIGKKWQF